jgi:aryl-alcohol dehydrogenase-like predicted oxidoreductase
MKLNRLGKSDLEVSEIGFGCMSLSEDYPQSERILHRAFDLGINFFDTADLYQNGQNERIVGRALKDRRDQVIIASKVGNQWRADGSGWDWNPSKKYILEAVHKSLERLQTDYIDLYQLHGGTIDDPIDETIEAFEQLKAKGLIRAYGISSIRPNVIREYVKKSNIVSVMSQYSLLDRRPEETVLDLLHENGISVVVRGAVAKGLLAGKPPREYLNHPIEEVRRIQNKLLNLSQGIRMPGHMAMKFVQRHPAVATIALGASRLEQLEMNLGVVHADPLTESDLKAIDEWAPKNVYEAHR